MREVEAYKSDKPVWRGMFFKSEKQSQKFIDDLRKNNLSVNGAAMSTSKSLRVAAKFAMTRGYRGYPLMVKIVGHKNGRDFEPLALFKNEKEVLFLKGSKFKLVGYGQLQMKNGNVFNRIILEEI